MNSSNRDFLSEEYTIETPENVTFGYEVAGIGSRFVGALVDTLVLTLALIILNVVLLGLLTVFSSFNTNVFSRLDDATMDWTTGVVLAIFALLNFVLLWGYYILFELIWNGQTPGKRVAKTRVVRMDGNPIRFWDNVIRNLVRFIDFMPSAYGVGLITMFCNRHARRLGDFAAGTLVVKEQPELALENIAARPRANSPAGRSAPEGATAAAISDAAASTLSATLTAPSRENDPLWARFPNVQQLSPTEYELVTDLLSRLRQHSVETVTVHRLAKILAQKLQMEPPAPSESQRFLTDLAEAYRRFGR
ncbi:MAG: RDD family protein [Caldilineaceae bacterium]|nr:RDD family protein [Caldilineaceae bacterium]